MKRSILIILMLFFLVSCTTSDKYVVLKDNYGIFLTDGEKVSLPITELKLLDQSQFLNKEYQENFPSGEFPLFSCEQDCDVLINKYDLDNVKLMLNKDYVKPVMVQIILRVSSNTDIASHELFYWEEEWDKEDELIFDIDHLVEDKALAELFINIFKLSDQGIIESYESFYAKIQENNEGKKYETE